MATLTVFVILIVMVYVGYADNAVYGPKLVNGQGQKVKFRERKPVLLAVAKTMNPQFGEFNLLKDEIRGPQLINGQGNKVMFRKRKPVLLTIPRTIHPESDEYNLTSEDKQVLRGKKGLPRYINSLYYYETDGYGRVVYAVWLYNLRDVAKLFINRFNIDIEWE